MVKPGKKFEIETARQLLVGASHEKMTTDFEGVFKPIGKVFIILHKIYFTGGNPKNLPIIYLRIKTSGFTYETKRMTYSFETPLAIKQGFMMYVSLNSDPSPTPSRIYLWKSSPLKMTESFDINLRKRSLDCTMSLLLTS